MFTFVIPELHLGISMHHESHEWGKCLIFIELHEFSLLVEPRRRAQHLVPEQ